MSIYEYKEFKLSVYLLSLKAFLLLLLNWLLLEKGK